MAGRRPLPTNVHVLHGNPGRRPLNENEPKPPEGATPPKWLKGRARRNWDRIAPILEDMKVLTVADAEALALLCDAISDYTIAKDVVRKKGMVHEATRLVERRDGSTYEIEDIKARPEVAIASDAWKRIKSMMVEFGITPSSRSRIKAGQKEEEDPFEEFLKKRNVSNRAN